MTAIGSGTTSTGSHSFSEIFWTMCTTVSLLRLSVCRVSSSLRMVPFLGRSSLTLSAVSSLLVATSICALMSFIVLKGSHRIKKVWPCRLTRRYLHLVELKTTQRMLLWVTEQCQQQNKNKTKNNHGVLPFHPMFLDLVEVAQKHLHRISAIHAEGITVRELMGQILWRLFETCSFWCVAKTDCNDYYCIRYL